METFAEVLAVGGEANSLGRASEVVDAVLSDRARLDELYACVFADDAWLVMRAIDSFEKVCSVHPEWIEPYIDAILNDLTPSTQPSVQWHLAQIFAKVQLTSEQEARAIEWLTSLLTTTQVDWIVSVNSMKALLKFYNDERVGGDTLLPLFTLQQEHASKTVRKKAAEFTARLH